VSRYQTTALVACKTHECSEIAYSCRRVIRARILYAQISVVVVVVIVAERYYYYYYYYHNHDTLGTVFLTVVGVQKIRLALALRETKTIKPESFDEIVCATILLLLFYRYCHVKTVGGCSFIRVCCGSCTRLRIMISVVAIIILLWRPTTANRVAATERDVTPPRSVWGGFLDGGNPSKKKKNISNPHKTRRRVRYNIIDNDRSELMATTTCFLRRPYTRGMVCRLVFQ